MAALSDYLAGKIAQFMFKNNTEVFATPGDGLYVALFVAATGLKENTPSGEVVGGSYARQQVPAADWTQVDGAVENTPLILFPIATAAWGQISHVGIMDALTGGNVLYWGAANDVRTIALGDQYALAAGDLDVLHG